MWMMQQIFQSIFITGSCTLYVLKLDNIFCICIFLVKSEISVVLCQEFKYHAIFLIYQVYEIYIQKQKNENLTYLVTELMH